MTIFSGHADTYLNLKWDAVGFLIISLPTSSLLLFKRANINCNEKKIKPCQILFKIPELEMVTLDIKASRSSSLHSHEAHQYNVCVLRNPSYLFHDIISESKIIKH